MITANDREVVRKWKILVVDDEPDNREVIKSFFSLLGSTVVGAQDGREALEILDKAIRLPDVMLVDLSMPVMDGWETLYRIRKNVRLEGIPVVAVTAHAMRGDRERALAAGFDSYCSKPVKAVKLVEDLLELVRKDHKVPVLAGGNGNRE